MTAQEIKNEGIFQLVIRAVKQHDPFLSRRKQIIFWSLSKLEISLEAKRLLARNAMLITELEHNTERINETSKYILTHYHLGLGNIIKGELPLLQDVTIFYDRCSKIARNKHKLALEKVETANKLLIKNLDKETREVRSENLTLICEVNIRLTDLSLMYNYMISANNTLIADSNNRQWINEYKKT